MFFISATRLKVKSILYLPGFLMANESSVKILNKTQGFAGGKELIDKNLVFWTITVWDNEECMKAFRNSLPHRKAMQKLPIWCNEASYIHWMQPENTIPQWNTVHTKMVQEGKITKVRNPSKAQLSKDYPEVKWNKLERNFSAHFKRK